jgi:hypothetical protein
MRYFPAKVSSFKYFSTKRVHFDLRRSERSAIKTKKLNLNQIPNCTQTTLFDQIEQNQRKHLARDWFSLIKIIKDSDRKY